MIRWAKLGSVLGGLLLILSATAEAQTCSATPGTYGGVAGTWYEYENSSGSVGVEYFETSDGSVAKSWVDDQIAGDQVQISYWPEKNEQGQQIVKGHVLIVNGDGEGFQGHTVTGSTIDSDSDWARGQTGRAQNFCSANT